MTIELRQLRCPHDKPHLWFPFENSRARYGEQRHWWSTDMATDPWFIVAFDAGLEVARASLVEDAEVDHYDGISELGPEAVDIAFFAVVEELRGQGIGTRVIRGIEALLPARRLFALSEEADRFWASLGWQRYEQPDEAPGTYRPLYVQPARQGR